MSRGLGIAAVAAVAVAALALLLAGGEDDAYRVRAIFDSGSFLVEGEEVRIAGATVGEIETVDVTKPGEIASVEDGEPRPAPGKAVIVLRIDDPGFQDFRRDASCHIRPQSLIGEKFVDCRPTLPRAPGSPLPPPLREIPEGEPGAGQLLLPVERNSTSVSPDLINNISRLPYAQRFRIILNELGAGLAARGEDLEEIVKRANPVLRDVNRLFGILARQRSRLAQLSADSAEILDALARERASVAGFFSNAGATAQASAERGPDLEASLRKLPRFLREFRVTLGSLEGFSDAAAPVFANLDRATPAFTRATRALAPFSAASTVALKSLGNTGEVAGPILRSADPVVRKTRDLARSGVRPTTKLAELLLSTEETGGFEGLLDLIYNTVGATNEFDEYGHFVRSLVVLTNCIQYVVRPASGCVADFTGFGARTSAVSEPAAILQSLRDMGATWGEAEASTGGDGSGGVAAGGSEQPEPAPEPEPESSEPPPPALGEGEKLGVKAPPAGPRRAILDYLLGP